MIRQEDAHRLGEDAALLLAQSDPLKAARVLFNGLRIQPAGGRAAVLRWLVEETIRHEPRSMTAVLADLQGIARRLAEREK